MTGSCYNLYIATSLGSGSFTLLDLDVNGEHKDNTALRNSSPTTITGHKLPQTPDSSNSTAEILLKPQASLGLYYARY